MSHNEHPAITWCRHQEELLRRQIEALRSGKFEHFEMRDGERVNITASVLAQTKAQLTEVETLIADYGQA